MNRATVRKLSSAINPAGTNPRSQDWIPTYNVGIAARARAANHPATLPFRIVLALTR